MGCISRTHGVSASGSQSIRAYAMSFTGRPRNALTGFSSTTPWTFSQGGDGINPQDLLRNPYPNGLIPALGNSQGLLTNLGRGVGAYDRNHPNGYMQNYSADFQYEIGRSMVLELGYAGHQGRKLVWGVGINDNQLPSQLLSLGPALDAKVANPFF